MEFFKGFFKGFLWEFRGIFLGIFQGISWISFHGFLFKGFFFKTLLAKEKNEDIEKNVKIAGKIKL